MRPDLSGILDSKTPSHLPVATKLPTVHVSHFPGVVLCLVLAGAAILLGKIDWLGSHGLSALTIAIVLGIPEPVGLS